MKIKDFCSNDKTRKELPIYSPFLVAQNGILWEAATNGMIIAGQSVASSKLSLFTEYDELFNQDYIGISKLDLSRNIFAKNFDDIKRNKKRSLFVIGRAVELDNRLYTKVRTIYFNPMYIRAAALFLNCNEATLYYHKSTVRQVMIESSDKKKRVIIMPRSRPFNDEKVNIIPIVGWKKLINK